MSPWFDVRMDVVAGPNGPGWPAARAKPVERRPRREAALALLGRYDAGPEDAARQHDRFLCDERPS